VAVPLVEAVPVLVTVIVFVLVTVVAYSVTLLPAGTL